jgi:hypothetical protein
MNEIYRSKPVLEAIARRNLKEFDETLLSGQPRAVPIEELAGHLGLCIEYQCIRKTGSILGQMVYEKTLVPVYFRDIKKYDLIAVDGKTIILDESLLQGKNNGRLRFTCAHEIAHWLLHMEFYTKTGQAAASGNPLKSTEENPVIERQANQLAAMLLMHAPQVKKAFYIARNKPDPTEILRKLFDVSKESMHYFLRDHQLISD